MAYYWQSEQQELIEKYYYCYTAYTSGQTRNECITKLLPTLEHIARVGMFTVGMLQTEENLQDIIIRIATVIMPKLEASKLQGAFNFIYISARRYIINKQVVRTYHYTDINECDFLTDDTLEADYNIDINELRIEILNAIDNKINKHKQVNKTLTIFLINLKEYIIQNNFDVRGFNVWIQNKMNIKKTTYSSLISRCGIRSKIFNEQLIKE